MRYDWTIYQTEQGVYVSIEETKNIMLTAMGTTNLKLALKRAYGTYPNPKEFESLFLQDTIKKSTKIFVFPHSTHPREMEKLYPEEFL